MIVRCLAVSAQQGHLRSTPGPCRGLWSSRMLYLVSSSHERSLPTCEVALGTVVLDFGADDRRHVHSKRNPILPRHDKILASMTQERSSGLVYLVSAQKCPMAGKIILQRCQYMGDIWLTFAVIMHLYGKVIAFASCSSYSKKKKNPSV
jgi:hypothetical protein